MRLLGDNAVWSYPHAKKQAAEQATLPAIRKSEGHWVTSYLELAKKVAELQFLNLDYVLMFRGQAKDYRDDKRQTTIKPTLFRPGGRRVSPPNPNTLRRRFDKMREAGDQLAREFATASLSPSVERVQRQRIVRWSILQHYEVCPTPLLDVTHSLRMAASFASLDNNGDEAFIYALAIPNLSGAITASAEAGIQVVRLSSVCPPSALRPHLQEGYLLGEYPEIDDFERKREYPHQEMDFGRRLIAKFRFNPRDMRKDRDFPVLRRAALYPEPDPLRDVAERVRQRLP